MVDYLMREAAPFEPEDWTKIDEMVVAVAKKELVGRKILDMVGPLGWGTEVAPMFGFEQKNGSAVISEKTTYAPLETLQADFQLRAKQLAMRDQTSFKMDLGAVAIAATQLVRAEDAFIMGALKKAAKAKAPLGDWDTLGGPFAAVSAAIATMRDKGFSAPFTLVMSQAHYAKLASLMSQGRREIEMVKTLADGGIFATTSLTADDPVLLLCPADWNMDLVVGQDIATAYLGNEGLDHLFRVMETLLVRVKRPGAICLLKD